MVVLTTFDDDAYVFEALRSGASGFLVKDTEPVELLRAVRVVAGGDGLLSPGVTRRLIEEFAAGRSRRDRRTSWAGSPSGSARSSRWSPPGMSNDEIAAHLVVSPGDREDARQPGDDQARAA